VRSDEYNCESERLSKNDFITSIGLDNFQKEVLEENRPVLVLCMRRDCEFQKQMDTIGCLSTTYGEKLKVCLLEEEFISAFKEKFDVKGTPTLLIFAGGIEKARMLGQVEHKALKEFLSRTLFPDQGGN